MSRIGKHKVIVPSSVIVAQEGNILKFKKGSIDRVYEVPSCLNIEMSSEGILLVPQGTDQRTNSLWGTTQKNIRNIVDGLDKGFKLDLELVGVGYKAAVNGKKLTLQLGYSHDIEYDIPDGISIVCAKPTSISVNGYCKKQVGDVAAVLRGYRKPEPYKGKGVIRVGEFVYRKEGKKK